MDLFDFPKHIMMNDNSSRMIRCSYRGPVEIMSLLPDNSESLSGKARSKIQYFNCAGGKIYDARFGDKSLRVSKDSY